MVFFGVVAILEEQHVFAPIIDLVLGLSTEAQVRSTIQPAYMYLYADDVRVFTLCGVWDFVWQPAALFAVNGVLSMVSDNVFVATIFIESISGVPPQSKYYQALATS